MAGLAARQADPGRGRDQGAQQARRDRRAVVVPAVHRRTRVQRHRRPAGPRPQLRPGRPGAGLRAVPGQGHRPGTRVAAAALPGPHRGAAADQAAVAPGPQGLAARPCSGPSCWPARCRTRSRTCSPRPGTPLFPRLASDLDMRCSCPDWGVPCKHLAAVCYVLAEEFDRDPFAMLAWRGKARDDLLAALRQLQPAPAARGRRPLRLPAARLRCRWPGLPARVPTCRTGRWARSSSRSGRPG